VPALSSAGSSVGQDGAMKIGVYNRYWSTGGGAEKYGGVIAQVLAGDGQLDLISHDPVDLDWLAERLHLDLAARKLRPHPGQESSVSLDSQTGEASVAYTFGTDTDVIGPMRLRLW
jgi:hypothetical protein